MDEVSPPVMRTRTLEQSGVRMSPSPWTLHTPQGGPGAILPLRPLPGDLELGPGRGLDPAQAAGSLPGSQDLFGSECISKLPGGRGEAPGLLPSPNSIAVMHTAVGAWEQRVLCADQGTRLPVWASRGMQPQLTPRAPGQDGVGGRALLSHHKGPLSVTSPRLWP